MQKVSEIKSQLQSHVQQLEQIEQLISQVGESAELIKLRDDIKQLIEFTAQLLVQTRDQKKEKKEEKNIFSDSSESEVDSDEEQPFLKLETNTEEKLRKIKEKSGNWTIEEITFMKETCWILDEENSLKSSESLLYSDEEENVTPVEIEKKAILQISDVYNPFEPSDDNEIENRKLTQNRESLGDYCLWEKHTRSIGSSLALAMGYVPGKGLGRSLQGTAAPVGIDVFLLPPNKTPGLGHSDREKYKENPKNKLKLKNKAENASKNRSRKKAENVFEFLNRINTVTQPKKIETIDKSLTKVEREKLDKERKLKNLVVLDKLKEKERKLEQAVKRNETKDKVVAQKFQSQLNSTRAKIYQLSNVEPVVAKSPIKKIL